MRRTERQTVGKGQLQRHLPAFRTGEIVCEMQVDSIALVSRHRYPLPIHLLSCTHQRECHPRVRSRYELSIQLQVETCCISVAHILSVICYLHIVHVVWYKIVQYLIVSLGRELIRPLLHLETVVKGSHKVYGALTLYLIV